MRKRLLKYLVFWFVIGLVIVPVNLIQIVGGGVWINQRHAALVTAPRSQERALPEMVFGTANNRLPPKPGEWRIPNYDQRVFDTAPTQVVIVPTQFGRNGEIRGSWAVRRPDKAIGIGMMPRNIVQVAYEWQSYARVIPPTPSWPSEEYDYLANLSSGSLAALRDEVKKTLGLVATREIRSMDALELRVHHSGAPGLKEVKSPPSQSGQDEPNTWHFPYASIANLLPFLESTLQKPIIDETGLIEHYDIRFKMVQRTGRVSPSDWIEQHRKELLEQLGLDLVATNRPVEVLVVKKINP